ncbi:MAG: hypothetical protein ABI663_22015 [Chryseolinea sp.]
MKKIFYILMCLTLLSACETIEDRESLGPILSADQLDFSVSQPTAGSNTIILESKTKGALPYWDWGTGFSNKMQDEIYIPFAGTFKMKYTAFCAGGTITDSVTFTIAENDDAFFDSDPAWKALTNGGAGQTWVWALDFPSGKIAGNGPEDCLAPTWWTMTESEYGQSAKPLTDEVYMDLQGAANFHWKKPDGSIVKGFFNVITPYTINGNTYSAIETIGGVTFPWPTSGKYHFTKMTDDELAVHNYKQYEISMFKRKGFNY